MSQPWTYVVTDIETDGPRPGVHSMRSIGCVAVDADGTEHGRFEAVLEPLAGTQPHPETFAWFQTVPGAWRAATTDPEPVSVVMARFTAWLDSLPAPRAFAASPLAFDSLFVDHYLQRFTAYTITPGPYETDRVFHGPALCLRSYTAAVTGRPIAECGPGDLPSAWLGEVEHNHTALDDALGYANLLVSLFAMAASDD